MNYLPNWTYIFGLTFSCQAARHAVIVHATTMTTIVVTPDPMTPYTSYPHRITISKTSTLQRTLNPITSTSQKILDNNNNHHRALCSQSNRISVFSMIFARQRRIIAFFSWLLPYTDAWRRLTLWSVETPVPADDPHYSLSSSVCGDAEGSATKRRSCVSGMHGRRGS